MVSIYCCFKTKTHEWWCRGHRELGVLICKKILEDLFVFVQRTRFLSIFERKRGVPGKGKTENSAALWRSVVLRILQTENLKRKNTRVLRVNLGGENKKASRIDWCRYKNGVCGRIRTCVPALRPDYFTGSPPRLYRWATQTKKSPNNTFSVSLGR